jgi:hypothetical protein
MKYLVLIKDLANSFWIDIKNDWSVPLIFVVPIFLLLFYFNYNFLEIGFLQLHSVDEYFFHGSLLNIYDGLRGMKPSLLFRTGFYSYGFLYFFINFIFAAPFLYFKKIAISIFIPKMVTSLFALISLIYVYKFARFYLNQLISLTLVTIIILMPGFWSNATWFHPDWMMTSFLLVAIYFLAKDHFLYSKYYWLAIILFGLAASVKFQAVTFLPILFLYCFNDLFISFNFLDLSKKGFVFIKSLIVVFFIFIISNPYLLHPIGYRVFIKSLNDNLISNATNHGVVGTVSISDKIFLVIGRDFISPFIFIPILIIAFCLSLFYFRRKDIFSTIAINFIINLAYLLFFVNKGWGWYYLPVIICGVLLFISIISRFNFKIQVATAVVFLVVHFIFNFNNWQGIFGAQFEKNNFEKNFKISNFVVESLKGKINVNEDNFLISAFTGFEFDKLGVGYNHIHLINGPFSEAMIDEEYYKKTVLTGYGDDLSIYRPFVKNRFIILKKEAIYLSRQDMDRMLNRNDYQHAIDLVEQMRTGKFGCRIFNENELVIIFSCV